MPRKRRAPVKRPRAQKTVRRAESFPLILRIERAIIRDLTEAANGSTPACDRVADLLSS